jgi:GNAT superfamily N-acetyltransferase
MLELEKIFPDEMRASREQFAQRLGRNDVCLMLARDDRETIAFVLCYQDPILPAHIYFGDTVGVKHGWQQKGVGSAIIQLVMTMPARSHYTDFLLYCRERSAEGVDLPAYYHRTFGARLLDIDAERVRMLVPIRMHAQPRSFRSEHLADSTILLVAGVSDDRQTYGL